MFGIKWFLEIFSTKSEGFKLEYLVPEGPG